MGSRYFVTGVQLGMLMAFNKLTLEQPLLTLEPPINESIKLLTDTGEMLWTIEQNQCTGGPNGPEDKIVIKLTRSAVQHLKDMVQTPIKSITSMEHLAHHDKETKRDEEIRKEILEAIPKGILP